MKTLASEALDRVVVVEHLAVVAVPVPRQREARQTMERISLKQPLAVHEVLLQFRSILMDCNNALSAFPVFPYSNTQSYARAWLERFTMSSPTARLLADAEPLAAVAMIHNGND